MECNLGRTPLNIDVFAVLSRLHRPVWVFDIDHSRVVWANNEALAMWESDSLEELTERDMGKDMSPDVAVRLRQYQADFKADANVTFSEVWTLYPRDTPHTMQMFFASFELDDGRMATLIEAVQDYEATTGDTTQL